MSNRNFNGKKNCNRGGSSNKRGSKNVTSRVDRKTTQPWDEDKATSEVKNNASMYFTSKELADQVSNFSFSNYLGIEENSHEANA